MISFVRINQHYPVNEPSLGLAYLASMIEGEGAEILDCNLERWSDDKLAKHILDLEPGIVGFSAYSCDFSRVVKIAEKIKQENRKITIVVGGHHVSALPYQILREHNCFDYLFLGESEFTFKKFLNFIENHKTPLFDGIAFKRGEGFHVGKPVVVDDLDSLPFPAWDLLNLDKYPPYQHGLFGKKGVSAPLMSSRGCPFSCTFCANHLVRGKNFRAHSPSRVFNEIKFLAENYGVEKFLFEDDNFTLDRLRVKKICKLIIKQDLDVEWGCPNGVRVENLNRELLRLMRRSGCKYLAFGIESGSERVLSRMRKNLNLNVVRSVVKASTKLGIVTQGFFIFGYPLETESEMLQTIKFAASLPLDRVTMMSLTPYPGSEVYHDLIRNGELIDFDKLTVFESVLRPKLVKRMLRRGYLEFYFHPKRIFRVLKSVRNLSAAVYSAKMLYRFFK